MRRTRLQYTRIACQALSYFIRCMAHDRQQLPRPAFKVNKRQAAAHYTLLRHTKKATDIEDGEARLKALQQAEEAVLKL